MKFELRIPAWFPRFRKPRPVPPKAKLFCEDCKRNIHRHEKYRIIKAVHVDCMDPKHVGQLSMPAKGGE